jgi:Protein of unknown function (DUF2877)
VRTVPAAAPSGLSALLSGPPRPVEVVAVLPVALHLRVLDAPAGTPPSVCLATLGAVRLPSALLLATAPGWPAPGTRGTVGAGEVGLPGLTVRIARWWRTPRPRQDRDLDRPHGIARGRKPYGGQRSVTFPEYSTVDVLAAYLVGRGPGLTPLGDDILAGALVTLHALGADADPLAGAVLSRAEDTTFVSAAMLWHAARGECVPELARLLTASPGSLPRARADVLSIGHTSGAGLLRGVELGLELAA